MSFQEILEEVKSRTAGFDAAGRGFLAVQVTLKDMGEKFYVEIKDDRLTVAPFEYNDRQANLIISSENFVKLINGKLGAVNAFLTGRLKIEGDVGKAKEMALLFGNED